MAQDNEQVCLLAFNIFSFICILYSCKSIYDLQLRYYNLQPNEQDECMPYITWKTGFNMHIIFFFVFIAFSVGTAQAYVDGDIHETRARRQQLQQAPAMVRLYKLKFEKLLDNASEVLKLSCFCFWGPFILIECLYSMAYFSDIKNKCQGEANYMPPDSLMNTMVYLLIIFFLIGLSFTTFIICTFIKIGKKIK